MRSLFEERFEQFGKDRRDPAAAAFGEAGRGFEIAKHRERQPGEVGNTRFHIYRSLKIGERLVGSSTREVEERKTTSRLSPPKE